MLGPGRIWDRFNAKRLVGRNGTNEESPYWCLAATAGGGSGRYDRPTPHDRQNSGKPGRSMTRGKHRSPLRDRYVSLTEHFLMVLGGSVNLLGISFSPAWWELQ